MSQWANLESKVTNIAQSIDVVNKHHRNVVCKYGCDCYSNIDICGIILVILFYLFLSPVLMSRDTRDCYRVLYVHEFTLKHAHVT